MPLSSRSHRLRAAGSALLLFSFLASPRSAIAADCTSGCGNFYTVTPCRLVDTRGETGPYGGPILTSDAGRTYGFFGVCGIDATAKAVSVNVTVVAPTEMGYLRFYPAEEPPPLASTINFSAGQTRANNAILRLSSNGFVSVYPSLLNRGEVHLVIDVNGYFD